MLRVLAGLVVASTVLAGGCGGVGSLRDDEGPTRAAFVAQAEERCAAAAARMRELGLEDITGPAPAGDRARLREALRARRMGYLEVRDLDAPAADAAAVAGFVDAAVEAIDERVAMTRAQEAGDPTTEATARDRAASSRARAVDLGRSLGFSACLP